MEFSFRILLLVGIYVGCLYAYSYTEPQEIASFNPNLKRVALDGSADPANNIARRDALIADLLNTPEEVVCLQGVQYTSDAQAIITGVSGAYGHAFSSLSNPDGTLRTTASPRCDPTSTQALADCLLTGAGAGCVDDAACAAACSTEYSAYLGANDADCFTCLGSYNTILSVQLGVTGCITGAVLTEPENADGLLLLSKCELTDTEFVPFHDTTDSVGYLTANVCGNYSVVCTHLTSEADGNAALQPDFATFPDQTLFEARTLINEFADNPNTLVVGDFGTGPAGTGYSAEFLNIYTELDAAFNNVPLDECDFCISPLNPYNTVGPAAQISHIFGTDLLRILCTDRTFDLPNFTTANGLPLSDHYGVTSKFVPAGYGYYKSYKKKSRYYSNRRRSRWGFGRRMW